MRRLLLPQLLIFLSILVFMPFSRLFASENPRLLDIQIRPDLEGPVIEISTTDPFAFVTYSLTNPNRLVVDPVDETLENALPEGVVRVPTGLIHSYQVFLLPGQKEKGPVVDYISFELEGPAEHLLESTDGKLIIKVRPRKEMVVAPEEQQAGPWTLERVTEFAQGRFKPISISEQEAVLAQMKVREAHRAMFPAATLRTSWTTGTASGADFREFNGGLQLEQPLYQSGRLVETYRQALVNLQVAEKRGSKVKADFDFDLAQAYFQWMGASATLGIQKELVGKALDFSQQTKKRFDAGLLTRLEFLNVQNQLGQAKFQRATTENDATLARLKLLQKMSLGPDADVSIPLEFPSVDAVAPIDLEELLELSIRYRPDIQVNALLVEFHEFEERIAKAKGRLKLDLSGFIGISGSAFETESLHLDKDYFVGLRASQNWGPHGATLSATTTKTSPRLGQTTRTDSNVLQGELGILNQLAGISEMQQARIGLEKARNDLEEVKATVFQEVHEAYLSYNRARLQLAYAREKIAFRKEQIKILEAQAGLNEILPSQVLEALMRLYDEQAGEIQAMVNYQVALAKLNKAVGLPGHYR